MKQQVLSVTIGLSRMAMAVPGYVSPAMIARLGPFQFPGLENPDGAQMTRHWAIRDVIIGVLTLLPATRRLGLLVGAIADSADVAAAALALRDGSSRRATVSTMAGAGTYALAGFAALRRPTDHDA